MRRVVTSAGAAARLAQATSWLAARGRAERVLVVGVSLEAAAEVIRAASGAASFGWQRLTPARLAALLARDDLTREGLVPIAPLGMQAVVARLVHQLGRAQRLGRYQPVWKQPGLSRALAATLQELRLACVDPGGDLGAILAAYEGELRALRLADRADVFRFAARARGPLFAQPLLLVDVPVRSALEEQLYARFDELFATADPRDEQTLRMLRADVSAAPGEQPGALGRVQEHLFASGTPPGGALGDDVIVLSTPGESRECVELARQIRKEALAGTRFDQMAVLLRAPAHYRPLLEEAFARAQIPAYFAQGTVRPDPAGRAFLALLACAAEGLSARRFGEYLSLGEVPVDVQGRPPDAPPPGERWVPPDAELSKIPAEPEPEPPSGNEDPDASVVAGSLRAPWRWEQLLLEAAVIGGRARWERRLDGLAGKLRRDLDALREDEARAARIARTLDDLAALRGYALPLLEALEELERPRTWGEYLPLLSALASRALRNPARVQSVLAELAPMGPIGPVTLDEVRLVLSRRLTDLAQPPSGRRQGRVFVGRAEQARGLSFEVVLVPGLAEKMFPQKVAEDPLLLDRHREGLPLARNAGRVAEERLALHLALGAARRKVVLSWPRVDAGQGRARVPSFYGLEVLRAGEGELPSFAALSRRAEQAASSRAGWPAPPVAMDAIDEAEHDLSLLAGALHAPAAESRGVGNYLLGANPHLARALRVRARRWIRKWTPADGLVEPGADALAALQAHQLAARSYSPTALQQYAACPYRFFLQAVHRLAPREVPEAVDEIDPLTRGTLIHEIQFALLTELQEASALPLRPEAVAEAQARLEAHIARAAAETRDRLSPAVERIWDDCIEQLRIDLREWLRRLAEEERWVPWRFELAFGLAEQDGRDAHSSKDPVLLDAGIRLRGSIDLVERDATQALRATDFKTGKAWAKRGTVIGGGETLQPALYALVLEKLFGGSAVEGGRLYYSTYSGDFESVDVKLDAAARGSVQVLAQTLGDALARGFFPAAPKDDKQCARCDFQPVCGPREFVRVQRKPAEQLVPLRQLREMP